MLYFCRKCGRTYRKNDLINETEELVEVCSQGFCRETLKPSVGLEFMSLYQAARIVVDDAAKIAIPDGFYSSNKQLVEERLKFSIAVMRHNTITEEHHRDMLCPLKTSVFPEMVPELRYGRHHFITESPPFKAGFTTPERYRKEMVPFCQQYLFDFFEDEMDEECFYGVSTSLTDIVQDCNLAQACRDILEEANLLY